MAVLTVSVVELCHLKLLMSVVLCVDVSVCLKITKEDKSCS